jgi:hypothetical protein
VADRGALLAPDEPGAHMARLIYFMLSRKSESPLLGDLPHGWVSPRALGRERRRVLPSRGGAAVLSYDGPNWQPDFGAILKFGDSELRMLLAAQ